MTLHVNKNASDIQSNKKDEQLSSPTVEEQVESESIAQAPTVHDENNPRFILARKTGMLSDVLPPGSLVELAASLRVLNLEQRLIMLHT